MTAASPYQPPIAIVGMAALTPGADNVTQFWRNVLSGRDMLTEVPETHWLSRDYYHPDPTEPDKIYVNRGGFLPSVDFDPMAFGIPPNNLPATDVTQLLGLLVADQVLTDFAAGRDAPTFDRDRVSVILGSCQLKLGYQMASRLERPVWLKSLREAGIEESRAQDICDRIASHYLPWQEATFPGVLMNVVAGRIANRFDLHGTNCVTDAACASALAALSAAANELATGTCEMAITGGVDTLNDEYMHMNFSKTPALSGTGDCRPFSDAADGTILGEALVMFAIKRLADAERDGDSVYAVLKGIGTSSDGTGSSIYAPVAAGQARALRRAYDQAGYSPASVELVEAHGTGTRAGDAAEFTALSTVFGESERSDSQWAALGSVKSQVGHTKSAAGAVGMLKAIIALQTKVLPTTIKVDKPNEKLNIEGSPFYLNTQTRPWIRDSIHPRRASVSSFGFGGSDFHVTLEEYQGPHTAPRVRAMPSELILLHASSPTDVLAAVVRLRTDTREIAAMAYDSQREFDAAAPVRLAIVAENRADLDEKLALATELINAHPIANPASAGANSRGVHYACGASDPGEIAFLFPGQGSQYPGMGADLAAHLPTARAVWDDAADIPLGDAPLHRIVFPVPAFVADEHERQRRELTATEWAQPALAASSLAQLAILRELGVAAAHAGGHSFGELVALHYAGVYDAATLVRVARHRGEVMRDAAAATTGVMAAVGGSREDVEAALADLRSGEWWIANHNSPRQVVLSGTVSGLDAAEKVLAGKGFSVRRLDTATAFHSPVVADAGEPLRHRLAELDFAPPTLPVYGNADAEIYPDQADEIKDRIVGHLSSPVRFVEQVERMYERGARTFIEVGSGSVVSQFVNGILTGRPHQAIPLDRKGSDGITTLLNALGQLAVLGVKVDFRSLWREYAAPAVQSAPPAGRMTVSLNGASYGRPYPRPGDSYPPPNPDRPVAGEDTAGNGAAATTNSAPGRRLSPGNVISPPAHQNGASMTTADGGVPHGQSGVPAPPSEWLTAFREMQQHAAAAHAAYQTALTNGHLGFLRAAEASVASLAGVLNGTSPASRPDAGDFAPEVAGPAPLPAIPSAVPSPPAIPQLPAASQLSNGAPQPVAAAPDVAPATMAPAPTLGFSPTEFSGGVNGNMGTVPAVPPADLTSIVLDVVVEKTGYPAEMLSAEMALEADLGIDSIKRVEILSAIRERVPSLPHLDPAELGKLGTLGQISEAFGTSGGAAREHADGAESQEGD